MERFMVGTSLEWGSDAYRKILFAFILPNGAVADNKK
jgi:hypothetical protein